MSINSINRNHGENIPNFMEEKKRLAKEATAKGDIVSNPNAKLDKDAFMKLLLIELQHQDPTAPMDTEKMLTQTSQLATLETQENTNKIMQKLATQMKNSMSMYALGAIGKMASLQDNTISVKEGQRPQFSLYFKDSFKEGNIEISDDSGSVIRNIPLMSPDGNFVPAGVQSFQWDGLTNDGSTAKTGNYQIHANYLNPNGKILKTSFGTYPVTSVSFKDGSAYAKLGTYTIPIEEISEFFEG